MNSLQAENSQNHEGAERISSGDIFTLELDEDFNFGDGKIEAFPIGNFSVLFLDPQTGHLLTTAQLGVHIRETKKLGVYAPGIKLGMSVLIRTQSVVNGEVKIGHAVMVRAKNDWLTAQTEHAEQLQFYGNDTLSPKRYISKAGSL